MKESTNIEVFDLKVLIKTMVLTHERVFLLIFDGGPLFPIIFQIATRLEEPTDLTERAVTRLSKAGWVVIKEKPEKESVVQPTQKALEVYGAFEIIQPESIILQRVYGKNVTKIDSLTVDHAMLKEFGRFLAEKYGDKFLDAF